MMDHVVVALGAEGRHLFDTTRDPRVRVLPSIGDVSEIDLLVFPCGRDRRFENLDGLTLPAKVRRRIADGDVGLVFDASLEGVPHKPDITARLHQIVAGLEAPFERCVYLTQDRQYAEAYRAHCRTLGSPSVSVLTYDYWVWRSLAAFADTGADAYQARLDAFRARPRHRRLFLTLNRTPRPAKILLLLRLIRDGLWSRGHISFGGFQPRPGKPGKPRPSIEQLAQKLHGFDDLLEELAPHLETLDGYGRVLLGMEHHGWERLDLDAAGLAADLPEYDTSWFSLVAETEMRPRPSRITEKVIKPLVNFHPLIVFGNPGALAMIRSYGFETFPGWCNEAYDEENDPRRRFDLAYAEVTGLSRLDDDALARLEARASETLTFNAWWGLTRFPTLYRAKRDAAFLDTILAAARGANPPEGAHGWHEHANR